MWIDAHNHLQFAPAFKIQINTSVEAAVVNATTEADWPRIKELAVQYEWVHPAFGLHPWFLSQRTSSWKKTLWHFLNIKRASVGEIGLDLSMKNPDFSTQQDVFNWQLVLATERNLPVTIHCVKAFGPLLKILRHSSLPANGFLLHAFAGSTETAKECADLGAYFSYSPIFLQERNVRNREVFRQLPLERLLVETDEPKMNSHNRISTEMAPSVTKLATCYENLAKLRDISIETLIDVVRKNFTRIFGARTN